MRKLNGCCMAGAIFMATLPVVAQPDGIPPRDVTDMLYAVLEADRAVYTKMIIARLVDDHELIDASENFEDDVAAPLPAQMFRFGSEYVADKTDKFSYSLQSLWPINTQNAPRTALEKIGLQFISDNEGENYYGEEELAGTNYFTAIYPDVAVSDACTSCHNDHQDSPRSDFELGEIMGGVVIRIPFGGS